MYTNADKLTAVMTYWLKPMGSAVFDMVLGEKVKGVNQWAKSVFPLPSSYSIKDDLGFLLKPSIDMMLSPAVRNMLQQSGVDEDHIPAYAHRLADAMMDECANKGSITLFESISLNIDDVCKLKDLLDKNLPNCGPEEYKVIA